MAEYEFDFVRIPCDYRFWTKDFDYLHPDESVFSCLDSYLEACTEFGMHLSLNIHRAPGYCINGNDLEKHNLWVDSVAQDGFVHIWSRFAERYRGVSNSRLSFDLLNEPPDVGQYGMTRKNHEAIMRRACAAIWAIDPDRALIIDGLEGGNLTVPELADLDVAQSCRGYQPMTVSHYQADWWSGSQGMPPPTYPGSIWMSKCWDRATILEFMSPGCRFEMKAGQCLWESSAVTTRRPRMWLCAGSEISFRCFASLASAMECGTLKAHSVSSAMPAQGQFSKTTRATMSTGPF